MTLIEPTRKADDDHVTFEDRLADLVLPVLPGLQVLHIHPNAHFVLDKAAIKFMDGFPVGMCMDQKDI